MIKMSAEINKFMKLKIKVEKGARCNGMSEGSPKIFQHKACLLHMGV
jgi:hypothetical protein